jgi:hypothetical protein
MQQTDIEQRYTSPRGLAELWAGIVLAPLAWSVHLSVSYFLAGVVCHRPWNLALPAASILLAGVALIGARFAWRNYTATGREWPQGDLDGVLIRSRFLAVGGLLLSALSVLLIFAQTIPMLVLSPCS